MRDEGSAGNEEIDREGESESRVFREKILSIESESLDRSFTVLLLLFFGGLLSMVPRYSPDSRLFPLVIGVPTFVLLGVLLLAQSSPRFADAIGRFAASGVFDVEERFSADDTASADRPDEVETPTTRRTRLVVISLWMVLLFGLVLIVGFLPAIFLFMVAFYGSYTDLGWLRSVGYSTVFTVLIIVVFDVVMGTRFYEGVLGVSLPI